MQLFQWRARQSREAAMPFIMLTVLIDLVSIGLILPVLPQLVGSFATTPSAQTFWYGVVIFAFASANFIGAPILGRLSDAYGRRPILLLGFCGLALNFFATAWATALWMLIAVRLLGGLMQANASVANAYVADITPPEDRARRFGLLGAMVGLGFIIGPVLGGLLGAFDMRLPFFVAGGLALANWLYGYWVLPESLAQENRRPFQWSATNPLRALDELSQLGHGRALLVVIACSSLAQFMLFAVWVLYTSFRFGWGPWINGWSLAASGLMSVLAQGFLLGPLLRRFTAQRLAIAGMLSATLAYTLWGLATQSWMMFAIIVLNVLSSIVMACIQSLISKSADAQSQGRTMGAVNALNGLMAAFGPLAGTLVLGTVSHLPAGDWRIGMPFFCCALLQAVAMILAIRYFHEEAKPIAAHLVRVDSLGEKEAGL